MIPIIRASIAILIIGLASVFMIPWQWLAVRFDWDSKHTLPQTWHRLVSSLIGVRITVHGAPDPNKPLLILANHSSWLDIPVIGSLAPLSFVADPKIKKVAVLRLLAKLQRTMFVERSAEQGDRISVIPGGAGARNRPEPAVALFAEGTTNAGNNVLPFDNTLAAAARDALAENSQDVWIQPLSIAYTALQGLPMGRQFRPVVAWTGSIRFLPHAWTLMQEYSIDAVVSFGEPVQCDSEADMAGIARQCEDSVRKMTANVLTGRDPF